MYKVKKRDGSLEDFDRGKVLKGALGAGASSQEAEQVVSAVEAWLPTVAVVGSNEISSKVIEVLKSVNPTAAASFESYQKPITAEEPLAKPSQPDLGAAPPLVQSEPQKPETQQTEAQQSYAEPKAEPKVESETEEKI